MYVYLYIYLYIYIYMCVCVYMYIYTSDQSGYFTCPVFPPRQRFDWSIFCLALVGALVVFFIISTLAFCGSLELGIFLRTCFSKYSGIGF